MEGNVITCKAAVAFAPAEPLQICTVLVSPPKKGEVRVKVMYASPCHTDEYTLQGLDPEGRFPCILGHEAAGFVEAVGEEVTTCRVGDPVILCYQPECFASDRAQSLCLTCSGYSRRQTNLCLKIRKYISQGIMASDGKPRFTLKEGNTPLFHFMGVSAFTEYTVVHQEAVAPISHKAALNEVCLLGCGVSTGLGAVWNTAKVKPGDSVAVFGVGAVGLACIEACRLSGASLIIAVDTKGDKETVAFQFGATHFICPQNFPHKKIQDVIVEKFDGGVDFSFACVGNVAAMRAALECTRRGWGVSVVIGVAAQGEEISTRPFNLITGRQWKGTAFGGWQSRSDMSYLVNLHLKSVIDLRRYVSHRLPFPKINEAFALLRKGDAIRAVLEIHPESH